MAWCAHPPLAQTEAVKKPRLKIVTTFSSKNFALGGSITIFEDWLYTLGSTKRRP